jgi:hypothetical protein
VIGADCLYLSGVLVSGNQARQQQRANRFELQSYRAAGLQLCDSRSQLPMLGISVIKVSHRVVQNSAVLQQKILRP